MKLFSHVRWLALPLGLLLFSSGLMAAPPKVVSIKKVQERTSKTKLSLCAVVDKYFYGTDGIAAKPYVKLSPNHYFNVSLSYDGICVTGLKPRTEYQISIHKDIPLESAKLDKSYTLSGTTTDYDADFNFPEKGYILPKEGEISIPVETMNVDELAVSLYRINTQNLIESINEYGLFRSLGSYRLKDIANRDGYFLWEKRLRIHSSPNETKTTAIPVGDFLKERKPGIYILGAKMYDRDGAEIYSYDATTQWFMISDIGLYTLRGEDGLQVLTRRLSSAQPYDNVKLELIAQNNELLYSTVSKKGMTSFPAEVLNGKKGLKAKAIYAYGEENDFSVLDLSRPAHDLSDRGVKGRENPGRYDAFIYSNRGIYRPGEDMTFHALLRNAIGEAQSEVKLSLKVFDSREVEIYTKMLTTDALGHVNDTIHIASSASTGKWRLALFAGDEKAIGTDSFLVEDFIPPKIKVEVDTLNGVLYPKEESSIGIVAKYLNGEPLPHANVEVNTILHPAKKPFKGYEAYHFGNIKEHFYMQNLPPQNFETDEKGHVDMVFKIEKPTGSSLPISAYIDISINELGGRPVHKIINRFFADKEAYIGIKPNFEHHAVDMEVYPRFNVVYLKDMQRSEGKLYYRLIAEETHWHWRSNGDEWEYYKTYSDGEEIAKGEVQLPADAPGSLKLKQLDWGMYRLEIRDHNQTLSTYRFSSGYEESLSKSSPDRLPIAIDKASYRVGEELRVNISPKFTGPVVISVAHHTILESKMVNVVAGEPKEVAFTVAEGWGSSAYILATAFRAQSKKLGANRAIGISAVKIAHPEQEIQLSLEHRQKTGSSTKVKVKIKVKGAADIKTNFTLAAVDEGILNLTNYRMPNPAAYFLGQQKLGIEIRDIYGDLIKARGAHAQFNVGSDAELEEAIRDDVVTNKRKVVAIFTKTLSFDKNGMAEVELDIPEYQGSLRLMAVAWNKKATGAASSDLIVKDRISAEYYMPAFLSVGDKSHTLLTVAFDESIEAGTYEIVLHTEGGVNLEKEHFTVSVKGGDITRFTEDIVLQAERYAEGVIHMDVRKEEKSLIHRKWEIGVRTTYPQAYVRKMGVLHKNEQLDSNKTADTYTWSKIHTAELRISGKPLLPVASLKDALTDYSGRCAEQTTSRAMPWLVMPKSKEAKSRIQNAIDRLLSYQKIDGGFGLWENSRVSMWVSAYVLDFLTRAKKAGYVVPGRNIEQGLNWLENHLNRWSDNARAQEADVYGLYVLTRAGRTLMSEIRFYALSQKSRIRSAQAWGHLGASLAYIGEKELARRMFEKARTSLALCNTEDNGSYYANYGGSLRDETALILLMQESKLGLDWQSHFADLALNVKKRKYLSTQEMGLLLRAAYIANNINPVALKLFAEGKALTLHNGEYAIKAKSLQALPVVTNKSADRVWYDLSFKATPVAQYYETQYNNGFSITKTLYSMDGKEIDTAQIRQNDRLVVVLRGSMQQSTIENPLITDWIAAGFELENPIISGVDATRGLKWLGKQTKIEHLAYRNDRFEAALSFKEDANTSFNIAYVVRAVTKGRFTLPPAKIEDMYQPRYRAFSRFLPSQIAIKDAKEIQQISKIEAGKKMEEKSKGSVAVLDEKDYLDIYLYPTEHLERYTIVQLNLLRNSIFAHTGLNFKKINPMLHKKFSHFKWYTQSTEKSGDIYKALTPMQRKNVHALLNEERRLAGGLVLADFYRARIKVLKKKDLLKFDKKQLRILRNSLFARYGLSFETTAPELEAIYKNMPWYRPAEITVSEIYDTLMSEIEKSNVDLMQKMEKTL